VVVLIVSDVSTPDDDVAVVVGSGGGGCVLDMQAGVPAGTHEAVDTR